MKNFRPPAIPLLPVDPYYSLWLAGDKLTDHPTTHWTGKPQPLNGLIRIDATTYRFLGTGDEPALEQTQLKVHPTRTIATFEGENIELTVIFFTPQLPGKLELMGTSAGFITCRWRALDQKPKTVEIYLQVSGKLVIENYISDQLVAGRLRDPDYEIMRIGNFQQPILEKAGDYLTCDWGYLYLCTATDNDSAIGSQKELRTAFSKTGSLPKQDLIDTPAICNHSEELDPSLAAGKAFTNLKEGCFEIGLLYDQLEAISYLGRPLTSFWKKDGELAPRVLINLYKQLPQLQKEAAAFDEKLEADAKKFGTDYAQIIALSYRQALAAHKLVADLDGTPLYFSKENFSNGCIATVDVTYPSSPLFLLLEPQLLEGMLTPIMTYAESPLWPYDFAPHDLGTFPRADGQRYPEQMPVEECGNMLILAGALTVATDDLEFVEKHWSTLSKWAGYLLEHGFDPVDQLCTDDFTGKLARNANLSLKAILALASYSRLAARLNENDLQDRYWQAAKEMASRWQELTKAAKRTSLTFENEDSWSLKYNLVWDSLLGFNLFPKELARKEVAWYLKQQNAYGTPLDNRSTISKSDWLIWAATLAEKQTDFEKMVKPLNRFLNETVDRVPFTDFYDTETGKKVSFQARSVVGGHFLKLLAAKWQKEGRKL